MASGAFNTNCFFIAVRGCVSMSLTAKTLYCWFPRLEFFPVEFNMFDISNVIDLRYGGSGSESYSVNRIFCLCGDFRARYRI